MSMVGTARAIFSAGPAKFTGHDHHVVGFVKSSPELKQRLAQIAKVIGQLPSRITLINVRVPTTRRQETQLELTVLSHQGSEMLSI